MGRQGVFYLVFGQTSLSFFRTTPDPFLSTVSRPLAANGESIQVDASSGIKLKHNHIECDHGNCYNWLLLRSLFKGSTKYYQIWNFHGLILLK